MKVVCIDTSYFSGLLTYGKTYDVVDKIGSGFVSITLDKDHVLEISKQYYNDLSIFITVKEFRDTRLKEIGL